MAIKIKYFIRTSKITTKEEVNIRVRFSNGRKFDLTALTKYQIKPEFWNNEKGTVRHRIDFNNNKSFAKNLEDLKSFIKNEYYKVGDDYLINSDWLASIINAFHRPNKNIKNENTLFNYIQNFIDNADKRINPATGNPVSYKVIREYNVTFEYLKDYAKTYNEPSFNEIDQTFYSQFVDLLRKHKLSNNTIGKKIQTLKTFLNSATQDGINKSLKYKSSHFKTLKEESDNIYLTKEELKKLYECDLRSKPHLERVRDLFIIASWTGLRYSDLKQITKSKIKEDILTLRQSKTTKKVVIPLHPTVIEILKKYQWVLPQPLTIQKYNEALKIVAKSAKINSIFIKTTTKGGVRIEKQYAKHEIISSHAARRSFCTNAYKDNIPTLAIMSISGHKTETAFLKYIKVEGEEHAAKVLNFWKDNI